MESLDSLEFEKILVYLGPSLSIQRAREVLPQAIFRPPAKQGDILSDVVNLTPSVIILIDGEIRQNLSPWHKELVYALQYPGVKAVYGAASMGALRAAELDYLGMIGIGQIYQWFRDGISEDDSEVVLNYSSRARISMNGEPSGQVYYPLTVPLCDIRAGVEHYKREFADDRSRIEALTQFFEVMQATLFSDRTPKLCEDTWAHAFEMNYPIINQKEIDAMHALTDFTQYKPQIKIRPTPDHLSAAFQALYDRDRKINVNGNLIPQQHVDSYCLLHNPEYERICWDSTNQELALLLCNCLFVMVSIEEVERESNRFQQRAGCESLLDFELMLRNNGWTRGEYDRLMVQNARIHKLQHALTVSKHARRNTQSICDYLRTHQAFDYWANLAAQKEGVIASKGIDDWQGLSLETPVWKMLTDHFEEEGLELRSSQEEYLLETGFSNNNELAIALMRLAAAKQKE